MPTSSEFPEYQDPWSSSPADVVGRTGTLVTGRRSDGGGFHQHDHVDYIDDVASRWRERRVDTIDRLVAGSGMRPAGGLPVSLRLDDAVGPQLDHLVVRFASNGPHDIDLRAPSADRALHQRRRSRHLRIAHELTALIGYWTAREAWDGGADHGRIRSWITGLENWIDRLDEPGGRVQAVRLLARSLIEQMAVENARSCNCPVALSVHARKVVVELRAVEFPPEPADRAVEQLLDRILEDEWQATLDYHASVAWVAERIREFDQLLRPVDDRPSQPRPRHRLAEPGLGYRSSLDDRERLGARIHRGLPHHQATARRLRDAGDPLGAELSTQLQIIDAILRWAADDPGERHRPLTLLAGQVEVAFLYPFRTRPTVRLEDGGQLVVPLGSPEPAETGPVPIVDWPAAPGGGSDRRVRPTGHGLADGVGVGGRPVEGTETDPGGIGAGSTVDAPADAVDRSTAGRQLWPSPTGTRSRRRAPAGHGAGSGDDGRGEPATPDGVFGLDRPSSPGRLDRMAPARTVGRPAPGASSPPPVPGRGTGSPVPVRPSGSDPAVPGSGSPDPAQAGEAAVRSGQDGTGGDHSSGTSLVAGRAMEPDRDRRTAEMFVVDAHDDRGSTTAVPAAEDIHAAFEKLGIGSRRRATLRLGPDWQIRLVTAPDRVGVADDDLAVRPHYRLQVTAQITTGAVHRLRFGITEGDWHRDMTEPGLISPDDPRARPQRRWWTGRDLETWMRRRHAHAGQEAILVLNRTPAGADGRPTGEWRTVRRLDTLNQLAALLVDPLSRALGGGPDGATRTDDAGRTFRPAPTVVIGVEDGAALDGDGRIRDVSPGLTALDLTGGSALDPRLTTRPTTMDEWLRLRPRLARNLVADVAPTGDLVLAGPGAVSVVSLSSPPGVHRERMEVVELAVGYHALLNALIDPGDGPSGPDTGAGLGGDGALTDQRLLELEQDRRSLANALGALRVVRGFARPEHHRLLVDVVRAVDAGEVETEITDRIANLDSRLSVVREERRHADARALAGMARWLVLLVAALVGYLVLGGPTAGSTSGRTLTAVLSALVAALLAGAARKVTTWVDRERAGIRR